jgi:hypothetical protein
VRLVALDSDGYRPGVCGAANDKHAHQIETVSLSIVLTRGHELSDQLNLFILEVGPQSRFLRRIEQVDRLGLDLARRILRHVTSRLISRCGGGLRIISHGQRRLGIRLVAGKIVDPLDEATVAHCRRTKLIGRNRGGDQERGDQNRR